jgi:hypothetical protein
VISGFNTDIEFDGVVYHVQTEDKGVSARKIISLVYDRGTILASKRVSYDEIADGDPDEKALTAGLSRQHKLICAAVKAGRIGELKEMTAKASKASRAVVAETVPEIAEPILAPAQPPMPVEVQRSAFSTLPDAVEVVAHDAITEVSSFSIPKPSVAHQLPADPFFDAPLFEDVSIIEEEELFLPAEAVEVVSELSGRERPPNSKLSIELLGESKFKGGDRLTVNFLICRGTDRKVVPDAQVMIKVLGSSFRPVIFHAKSDSNGLARVHLQLPQFSAGRAALLIRAMSGGEEIELRRIVTPG